MPSIAILAKGEFPRSRKCLDALRSADAIICCDGAATSLLEAGLEPASIVGDMDSLADGIRARFADRLFPSRDQECNDLTKAFRHSLTLNPAEITILGATGLREDHTLGNVSLLLDYAEQAPCPVRMLTDYGCFEAIKDSATLPSVKGQEISIFCFDPTVKIKSTGLDYPVDNVVFDSLWKATLNVASGNGFSLELSHPCGVLLFFADSL